MERWACVVLARAARQLDSRLQEPNRLDPAVHRLGSAVPRAYAGYCPGQRRQSVFQYSQQLAYVGPMDENVHHSQSIQHSDGLYAVRR